MKRRSRRSSGWLVCLLGGIVASAGAPGAEPDTPTETRFMRVHVPRDGLADVPLGGQRYVPMPREAFEAAVERLTEGADSDSLPDALRADAARYEAQISDAGGLEGRVAFDVGPVDGVGATGVLPLGGLSVTACTATTAAGVGAVSVFGLGDGTSAVATVGAGEYVAEWTSGAPRSTSDGPLFTMPLLPAVRSSIRLLLPPGRRPLLVGHELPPRRAGPAWLIEVGARPRAEFFVIDEQAPEPAVSTWSRIVISGREVVVDLAAHPVSVWTGERVAFDKDPALMIADVSLAAGDRQALAWFEAEDKRSFTCLVPAEALGTRTPLIVRAVGPLPDGLARPLPTLRPPAPRWAGGGSVVEVDSAWTLAAIQFEQCLAITAEAAAAWPLPAGAREQDGGDGQVLPARVYLEHQGAGAGVRVAVVPRTARIDVRRVTVVDFAPGVVVGVATCDVDVRRGEAFDLTGFVAPGWFIDTVDAVGWSHSSLEGEPASIPEARATEPLEWKVVRDARGDVLRIGLTAAAVPGRRLRLRITGHRAGAAAGAAFSAGEIDMVRLVSDTEDVAAIGFKTNTERAVEIIGTDTASVDPRLTHLIDDPAVRAWATVGGRSSAWQVRLVRRRSPLDVQAQVRLTVRDDRLSQSFTFECRPDASALDSLVVQFSEPMGELLEWSLLAPASGSMAARRLETADESWVVEFTPPVREAVTIRASQTVPFEAPLPIPLAWVEGAQRHVGEVIVRDAGRRRPTIDNGRLAELPPRPGVAGDWPTLIGEFSFTGDRPPAGLAAAELVPGGRDDGAARAWAWRETTSCWCHPSGRTEFETVFEIESHGRSGVVVGLPAGRRLQGIEIDGMSAAVVADENVAAIPIELPAGRSSFTLAVQSSAETAARGAWRVEPAGVAIDLPVLDRICRVALPPALEVLWVSSAWRGVGHEGSSVIGRLTALRGSFFAPVLRGSEGGRHGPAGEVFRMREFVPGDGRSGGGALIIVRRRWIIGAAVLVGCVVGGVVVAGTRRRPWLAPVACVIAGVAALWSPVPGDVVARAAWWAAIGATLFVIRWPAPCRAKVALVCLLASLQGSMACAAEAMPVFIMPLDEEDMALVPEPLYRVLVRRGVEQARTIRVVGCQVLVPASRAADRNGERWQLRVDVDALAAGVLELGSQAAPDGWLVETARIDGQVAPVTGAPARYDLFLPTAGRHRVDIDVRPRVDPVGDVEVLTATLPPAPSATVEFMAPAGRGPNALWCEAAVADGPFLEAPSRWSAASERFVCNVPQAGRVRLVRPQADGIALAVNPPSVESRNTVSWDLDACRVAASFAIDPGRDVAAPCIVRADRGLALVEPGDTALDIVPLPGNRYVVRAVRPTAGPWRFEMSFRRRLASPVGVFAVPGAWIERTSADTRTTALLPAGDLAVQVDAPAPFVMLPPEDRGGTAWRRDIRPSDRLPRDGAPGADAMPLEADEPRAWITVERRRQDIRGTQDVRVRFTAERTFIELDARFDASSTPLAVLPLELPADCVVDSVVLFDDSLQPPDPAARGPLDTSWRRVTAEQGVITMQRPAAGRFRLTVAAHVAHAPAATGRVPVVRALLPAAPVVVAWNESREVAAPERSWELQSDERPPLYTLRNVIAQEPSEPQPVPPQVTPPKAAVVEPRVELACVDMTFEDRGRAWGRARFDVVTRERVVRLALPRGMRLFEAFVDGQPTLPTTPGAAPAPGDGGEHWDITLYDTSWPRSIEVVYAGTVGGALGEDGPIAIAPPTLVGLPCARRIWTLRAPRDAVVHVTDPGRPLDAAAVGQERAAALAALRGEFEGLIEVSPAVERDRLRALLDAHERRLTSPDGTAQDSSGAVVHAVAAPIDALLTVRIARRRDPSLTARAWTTLALLAVGGTAWIVARRGTS